MVLGRAWNHACRKTDCRTNLPNKIRRSEVCSISSGAIGTTALGHLTAEFIFTWHICLFAALEYVASAQTTTQTAGVASALRRRIPLLAFLAVSLLYFFICRRLSLLFEWAFLIGFLGALPVVWITNRIPRLTPTRTISKLAVSTVGYACFYAATVVFLKSRY